MAQLKVLLVEDDPDIRRLVEDNVRSLGFDFDFAETGSTGLAKGLEHNYALVILDVMLPELNGLEVCQRLRAAKPDLGIMMLTARGEEIDRVLGLEFGADDYLVKPFSVPEFRARMKALLRRAAKIKTPPAPTEAGELVFGDLVVDFVRHKITLKGEPVLTTALEFELVAFLARNAGVPFTRRALLEEVWGYNTDGYETNVNTHVNRIRSKIEPDAANPTYLKTVRGVGYRFVEAAELAGA